MSIYILSIENEEDIIIFPFSTIKKGMNFIKNNFSYDSPRKVTNELWEGKNNKYTIDSYMLDQQTV